MIPIAYFLNHHQIIFRPAADRRETEKLFFALPPTIGRLKNYFLPCRRPSGD
jgi:hypothetical protein